MESITTGSTGCSVLGSVGTEPMRSTTGSPFVTRPATA